MELAATLLIATRLTPSVSAAIATIVVRGDSSLEVVEHCFCHPRSLGSLQVNDVRYGTWQSATASKSAEQVIVCRTRANELEIHCHGGAAICAMILNDLQQSGCTVLAPTDWPSESLDAIQRQAELDLAKAPTISVAAILLDQWRGALSRELHCITELLEQGNLFQSVERIKRLIELGTSIGARCRTQRVCFAGPPNVGKSSLLNACAGTTCAIVHHLPGTTRDAVEARLVLDGWPVNFTDTAGIRQTDEPIEREGIAIAQTTIANADLVIFVADATVGMTVELAELLATRTADAIVAWNKSDISTNPPPKLAIPVVATSAIAAPGIDELLQQIAKQLFSSQHQPGEPIPFRDSQVVWLKSILQQLEDRDSEAAVAMLQRGLE